MAGEFGYFTKSPFDADGCSSPEPTPPEPTPIFMVTPPASQDSAEERRKNASAFEAFGRESKKPRVSVAETEIEVINLSDNEDVETIEKGKIQENAGGSDNRRRLPPSFKEKEKEEIGGGLNNRRRLPPSFKGKEKVDVQEEKKGLMDFLDLLKEVIVDVPPEDDDPNEDWFQMLKRKGYQFPKPRWEE